MSGGELVVMDRGGRDVKRYPLLDGLATLGSDPACDIRVMLPAVSAHHATVVVHANQTVVRNVSDGETLVNGRAVSVAALQHGDVVTLGDRSLRWEYKDPTARRPMQPQPALYVRGRKSRGAGGGGVRRGSAGVGGARRDPALQLALEMSHRASMPGGGKQIAIVQPQRRDTNIQNESNPRLVVKPHRPYAPQGRRSRSVPDQSTSGEGETERSKRKSNSAHPSPRNMLDTLQNTTKATLWIESRKTSPRINAKVQTPSKVRPTPKRKNTPLRMAVLRKGLSASLRETPVVEMQDLTSIVKVSSPRRLTHSGKETPDEKESPKRLTKSVQLVKETPKNQTRSVKQTPTSVTHGLNDTPRSVTRSVKQTPKTLGVKETPKSVKETPRSVTQNVKETPKTLTRNLRQTPRILTPKRKSPGSVNKVRSTPKPKITKIEAPTKIDFTKQAALRLMTGHTPMSKLPVLKRAPKVTPTLLVKKSSPVMKTPQSKKSLGRRGSSGLASRSATRSSKRGSYSRAVILQISDANVRNSIVRRSKTSVNSTDLSPTSPLPPSPKKSALKDNSKRNSKKMESIKFDLSNLEQQTHDVLADTTDPTTGLFLTSDDETSGSVHSKSANSLSLYYSDSPSVKSPSPRKPIHSRSSKILERTLGETLNASPVNTTNLTLTLTPKSPRTSKSSRGSLIVQKALEKSNTSRSRLSKSLSVTTNTTVSASFKAHTSLPAKRNEMETYSIVDLISVDSHQSGRSGSEYSSANTSAVTYGTPNSSKRATRSSAEPIVLASSTPYVRKISSRSRNSSGEKVSSLIGNSPVFSNKTSSLRRSKSHDNGTDTSARRSKSSPNDLSLKSGTTRNSLMSSRKSKSLTGENDLKEHITVNSTRLSGASRSRSQLSDPNLISSSSLAQGDLTNLSAASSNAKSKRISSRSNKSRDSSVQTIGDSTFEKSELIETYATNISTRSNKIPKSPTFRTKRSSVRASKSNSGGATTNRISGASKGRSRVSDVDLESSTSEKEELRENMSSTERTSNSPVVKNKRSSTRSNNSQSSPSLLTHNDDIVSKEEQIPVIRTRNSVGFNKSQTSPVITKRSSSRGNALHINDATLASSTLDDEDTSDDMTRSHFNSAKGGRGSRATNSRSRGDDTDATIASSTIDYEDTTGDMTTSRDSRNNTFDISLFKPTLIKATRSTRSLPSKTNSLNKVGSVNKTYTTNYKLKRINSRGRKSNIARQSKNDASAKRSESQSSPISRLISPRKSALNPIVYKKRISRSQSSNEESTGISRSTPAQNEGVVTPENRNSPDDAGTPVLSIRSLLNSSRRSFQISPKSRTSKNLQRNTIGDLIDFNRKSRSSAKYKSLSDSMRRQLSRASKESSLGSEITDEGAPPPDNEENITPKSTVKPVQEAVKNKHSTAKKPQSKRSIIDNLNDSDVIKDLFNSPVKRKLSQSMTEFSRKHLFDDDEVVPKKRKRNTIALTGRTPDASLLDNSDSYTPEAFVSPLGTPANSPNLSGIKRLFRNSPRNDLTNVRGVKRLLKTPRATNAPKDDLTNVSGIKSVFAISPNNRLSDVRGIKNMFAASPKNDLRRVTGVKSLFQSQKRNVKSPNNDLSDLRGVRSLFRERKSPKNDLGNVSGVKRTLRVHSPKNDLSDVRGVKKAFKTKEHKNSLSDVSGVQELFNESIETRRDVSDSEALFDRLIGKPTVKAAYSKSFATKSVTKPTRKTKSLHVQIEVITDHVEDWLQEELKRRLHSKDKETRASKSNSKIVSKSNNTSKISRELKKLETDTVAGSTPIVSPKTRNSLVTNINHVSPGRKKSVVEEYGIHRVPIKKRSLVEVSSESLTAETKTNQLPLKKRALVHSTPLKGKFSVTANVSELGRVSPIALDDRTREVDATMSLRLTQTKEVSYNKPVRGKNTKRTVGVTKSTGAVVADVVRTQKATRSKKTPNSQESVRHSPTIKTVKRGGRIANKRRSSLVIAKQAPVLSPKAVVLTRKHTENPQQKELSSQSVDTNKPEPRSKRGVKNGPITSPKHSPLKKVSQDQGGQEEKLSPKKTRAKAVQSKVVITKLSPKIKPKKQTRQKATVSDVPLEVFDLKKRNRKPTALNKAENKRSEMETLTKSPLKPEPKTRGRKAVLIANVETEGEPRRGRKLRNTGQELNNNKESLQKVIEQGNIRDKNSNDKTQEIVRNTNTRGKAKINDVTPRGKNKANKSQKIVQETELAEPIKKRGKKVSEDVQVVLDTKRNRKALAKKSEENMLEKDKDVKARRNGTVEAKETALRSRSKTSGKDEHVETVQTTRRGRRTIKSLEVVEETKSRGRKVTNATQNNVQEAKGSRQRKTARESEGKISSTSLSPRAKRSRIQGDLQPVVMIETIRRNRKTIAKIQPVVETISRGRKRKLSDVEPETTVPKTTQRGRKRKTTDDATNIPVVETKTRRGRKTVAAPELTTESRRNKDVINRKKEIETQMSVEKRVRGRRAGVDAKSMGKKSAPPEPESKPAPRGRRPATVVVASPVKPRARPRRR